jgi:hypothetical protein
MRMQSIEKSALDLRKSATKRRPGMGSGGSNRVSTLSGVSGRPNKRRGETINVSSQQLLPDG